MNNEIWENAKFTKLEWDFSGDFHLIGERGKRHEEYVGHIFPKTDNYMGDIARIQSCNHIMGVSGDEAEANIRLMCHAPMMFKALLSIIDKYDDEIAKEIVDKVIKNADE